MKSLLNLKVGDKVKLISHEEIDTFIFTKRVPIGSIGIITKIFSWHWDSECFEIKFGEYTILIDRFNGGFRTAYKGDKPVTSVIEPFIKSSFNYC